MTLTCLQENPRCPSQIDRSVDVTGQTRVLKGHPRRKLRIYGRFPPQLKKSNETSPSLKDEACFHCIVWRAIPCSISNKKGDLTSLMALQRAPKNTATSLEGP